MLAREHWVRVPELTAGERSGLFAMKDALYGCYLRVGDPGPWAGPWAGIARLEMPSGLGRDAAVEAAAGWLPVFASALHRDARAPVNLTPTPVIGPDSGRAGGSSGPPGNPVPNLASRSDPPARREPERPAALGRRSPSATRGCAGEPSPAGERTTRVLAGYRRTVRRHASCVAGAGRSVVPSSSEQADRESDPLHVVVMAIVTPINCAVGGPDSQPDLTPGICLKGVANGCDYAPSAA